jgi:hypothetical protein
MRWLRFLAGWVLALLLLLLRLPCRYRVQDDPRPALRAQSKAYIYALLHAHQVNALFANDDPRMSAMVSRSADGDLLVPTLRVRRVIPVRGSSRKAGRDKGGREALRGLRELLARGVPALLAVDGPRGPRNFVHRGVADLAFETGVPVLPVTPIASRRWILGRTWDRFQIPKPGCTITLHFAAPLWATDFPSAETLAAKIGEALRELEQRHDPVEAGATPRRRPET